MASIFTNFDATNIQNLIAWLVIIYGAVLVAMMLDLICGIHKAKIAGQARTSTGLRKTAIKAEQYFIPMICLTCVDFIASFWIAYPFFTAVIGALWVIIEFKSMIEKVGDKQKIREAASTMSVVVKNKDDIANMIVQVFNELSDEGKENCIKAIKSKKKNEKDSK